MPDCKLRMLWMFLCMRIAMCPWEAMMYLDVVNLVDSLDLLFGKTRCAVCNFRKLENVGPVGPVGPWGLGRSFWLLRKELHVVEGAPEAETRWALDVVRVEILACGLWATQVDISISYNSIHFPIIFPYFHFCLFKFAAQHISTSYMGIPLLALTFTLYTCPL